MHAQRPQYPSKEAVIWDYHVVLWAQTPMSDLVWDDSYLGEYPDDGEKWFRDNFPKPDPLIRVRVVPATDFVEHFRSDRRYMRDPDQQPPWPLISPGEYNLNEYLNPTDPGPGDLLTLAEFQARFLPQFQYASDHEPVTTHSDLH
jgi:hypothetical protein